jgi:hypothetical protein
MNKPSVMPFLLWLGILVCTHYLCYADEKSPSPFAQNLAKGFAFSIYRPGSMQPVVSVRVEQLFQDLRRKGFFRVSLLKEVVAVGVTVDVRSRATAGGLMERVREMTRSAAKSEVSVRKIMLRLQMAKRSSCGRLFLMEPTCGVQAWDAAYILVMIQPISEPPCYTSVRNSEGS